MAAQTGLGKYSVGLPVGLVDDAHRRPEPMEVPFSFDVAEMESLKQLLAHEILLGAGPKEQAPLRAVQLGNDLSLTDENKRLREATYGFAHDSQIRSSIQQENERLAQENLLLRQAHGDMLFRLQSQALAMQGMPLKVVPTIAKDLHVARRSRAPSSCSLSSSAFEASTYADSSPTLSLDAFPTLSDDELGAASATTPDSGSRTPNTTVMMRNLPNNLTRGMLLELLMAEGFLGTFDFVYLPMDFQTNAGLGYAFINFESSASAVAFQKHFSGFTMWPTPQCDKVCAITWSTSAHGLEANIERYRNSPVMHESVADEFKPMIFRGSERVPFPPSTAKIRAPRLWRRRR